MSEYDKYELHFSWAQTFVVGRHWTCSRTLEFVDFKLYAMLLKEITHGVFYIYINLEILPLCTEHG